MSESIYVGIDPGLTGAVAILHESGKVEFYDMPVVASTGERTELDVWGIRDIIERIRDCGKATVGLEKVHAMPKNGAISGFSMGGSLMAWKMGFACFGIRYQLVLPARWKKLVMDGRPKEKDVSREVARMLYPSTAADLCLKRHHGRADSLLIAEYMRRTQP